MSTRNPSRLVLTPGIRDREQIGQRGPVEPVGCSPLSGTKGRPRRNDWVRSRSYSRHRGNRLRAVASQTRQASSRQPKACRKSRYRTWAPSSGWFLVPALEHQRRNGSCRPWIPTVIGLEWRKLSRVGICRPARYFPDMIALVAVEAVDPNRVERVEVALAHPREGQPSRARNSWR